MRLHKVVFKQLVCVTWFIVLAGFVHAKSCLWHVSDGTNTLYVQGSVHMLKQENYPLKPEIEKAYAASDVLVFEVGMDALKDPRLQQKLMMKGMGGDLEKELSPTTYAALEAEANAAGFPLTMLSNAKPWLVALNLSQVKMIKMGMDPALGLDSYLSEKAKRDGKTQRGFESGMFQIELIESLSELNADDFIQWHLKEMETLEEQMDVILNAWSEGNVDLLEKTLLDAFKEYPDVQKRFVDDRNAKWSKEMAEFMTSGQVHMIVVGALHLPGEKGVLSLLKKQGYTIKQL